MDQPNSRAEGPKPWEEAFRRQPGLPNTGVGAPSLAPGIAGIEPGASVTGAGTVPPVPPRRDQALTGSYSPLGTGLGTGLGMGLGMGGGLSPYGLGMGVGMGGLGGMGVYGYGQVSGLHAPPAISSISSVSISELCCWSGVAASGGRLATRL